ncbi:hypothetical protein METHB2_550002 [Candidatus Methylobacter favarea]|uniref:Uncharacterized protein n=1 Tax=Candidatus Methylobacter favarea TaxID=2707345 RepID=A0A8S0XHN3_9GAMM|nr:hypothetical protein [Candidatus Methylobacter favarea]CAA9891983.1 hypothetical protein METHB2_550002 [Candidatus Methylobacter favarea]
MNEMINKISNLTFQRDPLGLRIPADMSRWCSYSLWTLHQAVAVLLDLEPNEKFEDSFYTPRELDEIYECLKNDILTDHIEGIVDGPYIKIKPELFVKWADAFFAKPIYLPVPVNSRDQRIEKLKTNLAEIKLSLQTAKSRKVETITGY